MKRKLKAQIVILVAAWFVSASVRAQLDVQIELSPAKALLHESVVANVEISNNSANALRLGGKQANAEMEFTILSSNGRLARLRNQAPLLSDMVLIEPWKQKTVQVDIASRYRISQTLPYSVVCNVSWDGGAASSNKEFLSVVPGMPVLSRTVQIPGDDILKSYMLFYIYRDNKSKLLLRIENDESSVCYGVYELGDYVRMQDAEMNFDDRGRAHILHQSGPRRYSYHRFSKHGKPDEHKFYSGISGAVHLRRLPEGGVRILGGREYEGDSYTAPYEFNRNKILE